MELLNPELTITNASGDFWLVRFKHRFDEHQVMDVSVQITKMPDAPVIEIIRAALARLQEMVPPDYR